MFAFVEENVNNYQKKGYTNLIRHITVNYPEWQQEISQKKQNTLSFAKTNKKGIIIHSWME